MEVSMADYAFQVQYRDEFIAAFEQNQSLLRETVTTEAVIKGNQATFLVAGSGGAEAVTRGINGMIPARGDDLNQKTATLVEWHDLVRKTNFNVFASQGNQRAIMQKTTMGVINRKTDQDIITTLNTATQDTGSTATASLSMVMRAQTILGNNEVPFDGNLWGLITPAFRAYLLQIKEFASAEFVSRKPLDNGEPSWKDRQGFYRWADVNWIVHPNLPGVGTNAEKCFLYHSASIGHAANTEGLQTPVGYNEEQGYSWARASIDMGATLLQNSGVIVMNHDGSAYVAE
jgi:hypothetical protein